MPEKRKRGPAMGPLEKQLISLLNNEQKKSWRENQMFNVKGSNGGEYRLIYHYEVQRKFTREDKTDYYQPICVVLADEFIEETPQPCDCTDCRAHRGETRGEIDYIDYARLISMKLLIQTDENQFLYMATGGSDG